MDGLLFQPDEGTTNEYGEDEYEYDYAAEQREKQQD